MITHSKTDSEELLKTQSEISLLKEKFALLEEQYSRQITELNRQLEWFKKQIFGKKSERIIETPNEELLYLPGLEPSETIPPKKQTIPAHERRSNGTRQLTGNDAITLPDDIPVETTTIDLTEEEKVCPETGKPLVKIGEEVTSKIAHRPGSYYIKKIIRFKYALPQKSEGGIRIPSFDPPYRIYNFRTNRQHQHAADLLKDYRGVLHSDKYGAYEALANQKRLIWSPCFVHIRRKFFEAEDGDLEFRNWVLRKIRYLFMYEKVAWARSENERLRIRQKKESPIIDELIEAIKDKLYKGNYLPKSKFREALGYFCGLIPHLKNYHLHPWSRLDNNIAERAVRPLAIGRKNWLFVGNKAGGEAAAVIFSLVQTCRGLGIPPRDYLENVMRRLMSHPINKLSELLPDQWAKSNNLSS